jgi:hypothetical protein
MLADKFWIGPKGEILWVVDNYEDSIRNNLTFFNLREENANLKVVYKLGFIEGDYSNDVLILRSSNIKFLHESLNKIKKYIGGINHIELHLIIDDKILSRRLIGNKEIYLFLEERIFARRGFYLETKKSNKINFWQKMFSIINNLYAKKTKTNTISK